MKQKIIHGDCIEEMKELPDNSVDSIVTDPPYELGFMGKHWDGTGIANSVEMWREALRVLKPGGHLLAFSGTRTYHRMAVAIEDAGFEVRDMIAWVYGSGFPKSLNIGKAVDKLQGNEREELSRTFRGENAGKQSGIMVKTVARTDILSKGTSEWEGWGTALKPAHEPICMARKPLAEKTVAENCLKYGTGGINIDESRVGTEEKLGRLNNSISTFNAKNTTPLVDNSNGLGRFPANLIHDNSEEVRECFPETKSGSKPGQKGKNMAGFGDLRDEQRTIENAYGDSGNASRFFKSIIYQAKASKSERNRGLEDFEDKERVDYGGFHSEKGLIENNRNPENRLPTKNNHPTVKPIALMEYLIKMVTPKGGTVLDPFMGSGSTGVAAKQNGYGFIGIDMTPEYIEIAQARIGV